MDRPKRPPPLPKFEDTKDQAALQQKLNSFISSLTPIDPPPKTEQQIQKQQPKTQQVKKKMNLANINSKLNNMLSAKKINLNALYAAEGDRQKEEKEEKVKKVEADYDPQFPNSYQACKNQYLAMLESQREQQDTEESVTNLQQTVLEEQKKEELILAQEKEQIALRMMQKFGYKVGEGLGKQGQGIKTPLIVKKTNDVSGIIQPSSIPLNQLIPPEISAKNALCAHNIEIEKCIAILGLQLEEGTLGVVEQECQSLGTVVRTLNYMTGGQLRIFVEFGCKQQALKAFIAMNSRYLGDKFVSVRFYSPALVEAGELDRELHTHIPT